GAPEQDEYVAERLDHLGIVAGVCREIGLTEWLDGQDEQSHERVRVGTATVAMILNGLGFSNRRLYLVPQFFATKAVERLLGPGSPPSTVQIPRSRAATSTSGRALARGKAGHKQRDIASTPFLPASVDPDWGHPGRYCAGATAAR